jgi:hypothetical protein
MSNNAYLKDESILALLSLNNLIIPEIQRDYVWGAELSDNKTVLAKFLNNIKETAQICETCGYSHSTTPLNVGFLYSYKPSYVSISNERQLDEFIIDGQQRITTIFLLLLCRAVIEGRMSDFLNICRYDENTGELCFNYKVRGLTRKFVVDLLNYLGDTPGRDSLNFLKSGVYAYPSWILKDYQKDVTTSSMINTMRKIIEVFGDGSDGHFYYDFILNNIRFWHFKTEATSQGEELYITMNSRGVHLQSNETQKATVLPSDKLCEYGKKWEELQDFFWKNRGKNENADIGLNNYISCLGALKRFRQQLDGNSEGVMLNIEDIVSGVEALQYLTSEELKDYLSESSIYGTWFDSFKKEVWARLNNRDMEWNIPVDKNGYNNARQQRINSMLLWAWIYYFNKVEGHVNNIALAVDIIHFYYVRYLCKKRSSKTIFKIVDKFCSDNEFRLPPINAGGDSYDDDDDSAEQLTDSTTDEAKRFSYEERLLYAVHRGDLAVKSLLWELQDMRVFRDGCEYGNQYKTDTCLSVIKELNEGGKLVSASQNDKLQILQDAVSFLETITMSGSKSQASSHVFDLLRSIMIVKSPQTIGLRESPWYYRNYACNYWTYIVRTKPFLQVFEKMVAGRIVREPDIAQEFKTLLKTCRTAFFEKHNEIDYASGYNDGVVVIIYDAVLSDPDDTSIWSADTNRIIFSYSDKPLKNPLFKGQDSFYTSSHARYMGGYGNLSLKELPDDWKDRLREKYPCVRFVNFID